MRPPQEFLRPLALGAPMPTLEREQRPMRAVHIFDPGNNRMVAKLPELGRRADVLLANLEDAIEPNRKAEARIGAIEIAQHSELNGAQLWVRVNSLDSPWFLDDVQRLIEEAWSEIDVIMVPKVEGPEDVYYLDRLLAQLEARAGATRPMLVHILLETARAITEVIEICRVSPRLQGISIGPGDLAADRGMRTVRVGGPHPEYKVRGEPDLERPGEPRPTYVQDLWQTTISQVVDACTAHGIPAFCGPYGDIHDAEGCSDHFRNAAILGCVGGWTLHPDQIEIASAAFSPPPTAVAWATKVIDSMVDGTGVVVVDGKMQDEATVRSCRSLLDVARQVSARDPEMAARYGAL